MAHSSTVMTVGAVCFGVVTGYVTYRTLARTTTSAQISDLAAVLAAVGGGAVTALFPAEDSDAFGWYAIGLLAGMALYLVFNGKQQTGVILGGDNDPRPR